MRSTLLTLAAAAVTAVLASQAPSLAAADPAASPSQPQTLFSVDDLLYGKRISRAECQAIDMAVWVTADYSSECLRYYMSAGDAAAAALQHEAVVLLHGDFVETAAGKAPAAPGYDKQSVESQTALAARSGKAIGRPALVLARPGTLGSSGNELFTRHRVHEARLIEAALDAIAVRYGIQRYDLVGQSGGSILIGALLAMRSDIGCASIGSGRLGLSSYVDRPDDLALASPKTVLDDQRYVGSVRRSPNLRAFVISDPQDVYSPIAGQTLFVARAVAAGLPVTELMTVASPDKGAHHAVMNQSLRVMKECVQGTPDAQIAEIVRHFAQANADKWAQLPASGTAAASGAGSASTDRVP